MTEQAPKPLEDILAAVRSTLLPSPDDALVRALVEIIEARIEADRQENAALRARVAELEAHARCSPSHGCALGGRWGDCPAMQPKEA